MYVVVKTQQFSSCGSHYICEVCIQFRLLYIRFRSSRAHLGLLTKYEYEVSSKLIIPHRHFINDDINMNNQLNENILYSPYYYANTRIIISNNSAVF